MLKVIDFTLDYKKDIHQLSERLLDQLRRSKRTILLQTIQWTGITTVCFLLIYGTGALALYNITFPRTGPANSDLEANYGEWTAMVIPPVDPEIIAEIKKDKPQNPKVFMNPEAVNPDEDPFIINRSQPGTQEPPINNTSITVPVASEPENTRPPDQSPTSTPIMTIAPTSSPTPTLLPTSTSAPPTPTSPPTNTSAPPTATQTLTLPPTNTPVPPTPTSLPTNTPVPPTPTSLPTNTSAPPTPTSPPTPTDQPLVTICHISWFWWIPPRTIQVPQDWVEWHLAHGDYLGECIDP